jgi:hypothetical protein
VSNKSGGKHAITSWGVAGPGTGILVGTALDVLSDEWPILTLFSPPVLGSGEGDRGWVLAMRNRDGMSCREGQGHNRASGDGGAASVGAGRGEGDGRYGLDRLGSSHFDRFSLGTRTRDNSKIQSCNDTNVLIQQAEKRK